MQNSKLIQIINNNENLIKRLEDELLFSFQKQNPNISYVNLNIIDHSTIQIVFWSDISIITDNIASCLSTSQLNNFCNINKSIKSICEGSLFWITLFNNRFGNILEWINKDINYKKFYIDILFYVEYYNNNDTLVIVKHKINKMDTNSLLYLMKNTKFFTYDDIIPSKNADNLDILEYIINNYLLKSGDVFVLFNKLIKLAFSKSTYNTRLIDLFKKFLV